MNKVIPPIPIEYIGKIQRKDIYKKTIPRQWTKEEIEWTKKLLDEGYTRKEISISLGRSEESVGIKIKRLRKKNGTYNANHIEEKYKINDIFLNEIQPNSILDLYCGEKSFYKELGATTNDINENIEAEYHEDAFKLICKLYYENKTYDLIDLDPFGSAYDCFDIAIKMAKKGLVITLGELGHKRWKRLDFVSTHYDIENFDDFTMENIIKKIQQIGRRNKKELEVYVAKEWKNIGRVYFKIKPYKITSQWEGRI